MAKFESGTIFQSDGPIYGDRIFYVLDGARHWVQDAAWLEENGFHWPNSVVKTTDQELAKIRFARPTSRKWSDADRATPPRHSCLTMREVAASFLHGSGVEIGAASNPLPIPLNCTVTYGDRLDQQGLLESMYPGQRAEDMIDVTLQVDLDNLDNIPIDGADFIACAHVIEHTPNPIGSILNASRKIRFGGQLLLIVPDMTQTFDRDRPPTKIHHLIEDFYAPSRERDKQHFQEFYRMAFPTPADLFERTWSEAWATRFPIHYHVWTHESFQEMTEWIIRSFDCYSGYWSQSTIDNEFYFVLHRRSA